MRAELIPAQAELLTVEKVTEVLEGRIHTVELYAGLQEELVCVREGDPADPDAKVHLMQRMHFMDEESLARYEAGGMDFEDVEAFDQWLARDGNFGRILPHKRCVVAFRIRRDSKDYGGLDAFIKFRFNQLNEKTFLYIRNGRQLWRMCTSVEFGEELFPRREDEALLGDQELWIKANDHDLRSSDGILTRRQRDALIDGYRAQRAHMAQKLWQWHRAGKPSEHWICTAVSDRFDYHHSPGDQYAQTGRPHQWHVSSRCEADEYELLTPESLYYDDAMKRVRAATLEHNRVAVVVQGLLDRSTCLHPHPPWQILDAGGVRGRRRTGLRRLARPGPRRGAGLRGVPPAAQPRAEGRVPHRRPEGGVAQAHGEPLRRQGVEAPGQARQGAGPRRPGPPREARRLVRVPVDAYPDQGEVGRPPDEEGVLAGLVPRD